MRYLLGLCVVMLVACASPPKMDDKAPPPISAAAIPDAIPRYEPILAAGNKSPYRVHGKTYRVRSSADGYVEEGVASWYGLKFHGRQTSNGERFSVYSATAAHRSLPIPTYVRVTNLNNGRSMVVRVNDRGPFHSDRIIDLSYGAAVKLGFADQGTAPVRVEAIVVPETPLPQYTQLQLGAFASEAAAMALKQQASEVLVVPVVLLEADGPSGPLYRLRAGPFKNLDELKASQQLLATMGLPEGQPLP